MTEAAQGRKTNRRALLTVAAVAGAAAAGAKLLTADRADAATIIASQNDPLLGGQINTVKATSAILSGGATTYIASNVPEFSVLNVSNTGPAGSNFNPAVQAASASVAISARAPSGSVVTVEPGETAGIVSFGGTYGLLAKSGKHGVNASGFERGVVGKSDGGHGVEGEGLERGVFGNSAAYGVYGTGGIASVYGAGGAVGVEGASFGGTGVVARRVGPDTNVLALDVIGAARFSSAGEGTVLKNTKFVTVNGVECPAKSRILVTLNGDSGPGNALRWARRVNDTSFKVQLLNETPKNVKFSYFIMKP